MSHNTFGHLFRVTTWGESHGPAIGCVVDGCPPGIALTEADIQVWLDKRRPGQGKFVTQRQEPDTVKILSGVFEDERTGGQVTTGTPISMIIENVDQRSRDYSEIATRFRPGHARPTPTSRSTGVRDYRGGGATVGAGDRLARRCRGDRPQDPGREGYGSRGARADWSACGRSLALGLGRSLEQPVLVPGPGDGRGLGRAPGEDPQGRFFHRRHRRGGGAGRGRPAGARRSTASWTANWPAR